ncbi:MULTISPECIES: energy transducer TonB [unclassified Variovorax]|uniref:energy transducer TonB n=1 Tax=unclassified Variovorax TaxID=663243 RepID=UPI000B89D586|nr:energy transducer TonB [Variovorax sp. CF079]
MIVSDRFSSSPPSVLGLSRNAVIAGGVVLFHVAALWALQSGLLRRAAEVVIPVEILSEFIEPPKPAEPPPPPPEPPKREVTKTPPPPRPQAIREPKPTPAPNAPTGSIEPPPPPAPIAPPAPAEPPAPPASPPAPPAPKLVEISQGQTQYIREPRITYPAMSKRLGETGTVVVAVYFNSAGLPKRAEIFKSSGYDRLDQAAREAAMSSQVTPIRQPGADEATVYLLKAPFNFTLSQ